MTRTREAALSQRRDIASKSSNHLLQQYSAILARTWFTHSDVFALLKSGGLSISDYFVQAHGLLDAMCYADICAADLVNSHLAPHRLMDYQVREPRDSLHLREALGQASDHLLATVDLPGLSLLATLDADDISRLRQDERSILTLAEVGAATTPDEFSRIRKEFSFRLVEYWQTICDYIATKNPQVTRERTQFGIFATEGLGGLGRWYRSSVSIGFSLAANLISPNSLRKAVLDRREGIIDTLSLQMIATRESESLRKLRSVLPRQSWLSSLAVERAQRSSEGKS